MLILGGFVNCYIEIVFFCWGILVCEGGVICFVFEINKGSLLFLCLLELCEV